jgi:hypothetical protein
LRACKKVKPFFAYEGLISPIKYKVFCLQKMSFVRRNFSKKHNDKEMSSPSGKLSVPRSTCHGRQLRRLPRRDPAGPKLTNAKQEGEAVPLSPKLSL